MFRPPSFFQAASPTGQTGRPVEPARESEEFSGLRPGCSVQTGPAGDFLMSHEVSSAARPPLITVGIPGNRAGDFTFTLEIA